jgi:hypothetical protein
MIEIILAILLIYLKVTCILIFKTVTFVYEIMMEILSKFVIINVNTCIYSQG